jgi:hypothetical protein
VALLLLEELQDHELEIALVEHASATTESASAAWPEGEGGKGGVAEPVVTAMAVAVVVRGVAVSIHNSRPPR